METALILIAIVALWAAALALDPNDGHVRRRPRRR